MPAKAFVALTGCVAFLAACSGGGTSSPADVAFLAEVHASAPDISSSRSDSALVGLGHAACDTFSSGASYEELADRLTLDQGAHALPSQDLGAVVTAAADNFCPRYRDRVSGS